MTIEFTLPDIGEGLDEAEVIEWHVQPGDTIARDQPFVDILTDKAQTEMPAPGAGIVVSLGAAVGDVVKVGDVLIVIDDGRPEAAPSRATTVATSSENLLVDNGSADVARRPKASPVTRRRAAQLGVDLTSVTGSGPGGRILGADVEAAASADPQSSLAEPTASPRAAAAPTVSPAPSPP